jgi:hypothetical protein
MRNVHRALLRTSLITALLSLGSAPLAAPGAAKESSHETASAWENGRAVQIRELGYGAKLLMGPGAEIRVERPTELVLGAGNARTTAYVVRVVSGRVDIQVPEANPPRIAVMLRGPGQLAAIFKGGKGAVVTTSDRLTAVSFTGEALAGSGNSWLRVPAQHARNFGVSVPSRALMPLVAAPQSVSGTGLALVVGNAPAKARFHWPPVSGAKSYDVLVTRRDDRQVLAKRSVDGPELSLELPAGRYQVEARARDIAGIEGPSSAARDVRVVAVELPAGAVFDQDKVRLGATQRIRFADPLGLEATYDDGRDFVQAPQNIGPIQRRPTLVRLREAGGSEQLQLKLEPRIQTATVELGPRQASWPRDRITVTIRSKSSDSTMPKLMPRVLLNTSPVAVQWERRAGTWTGVVPRPPSKGPWVVRVEVENEFGELLARDHLEVAASSDSRH